MRRHSWAGVVPLANVSQNRLKGAIEAVHRAKANVKDGQDVLSFRRIVAAAILRIEIAE